MTEETVPYFLKAVKFDKGKREKNLKHAVTEETVPYFLKAVKFDKGKREKKLKACRDGRNRAVLQKQ